MRLAIRRLKKLGDVVASATATTTASDDDDDEDGITYECCLESHSRPILSLKFINQLIK